MNPKRVVISGFGVISPFGIGIEPLWKALMEGKTGIQTIYHFDPEGFPVKVGAQVSEIDFEKELGNSPTVRRNDRTVNLSLLSTKKALEMAKLNPSKEEPKHAAVIFGHGAGFQQVGHKNFGTYFQKGWRRINPFSVPQMMHNSAASTNSIFFKLTGANYGIGSACSSGSMAMGEAFNKIRFGLEKMCVVNGSDTVFYPGFFGAWCQLRVMSRIEDPALACRPFDQNRDGVILGEASTTFVIENLDSALRRNAPILGEIIGHGTSSDAFHITTPNVEGQILAVQKAMEDAQVRPDQIGHINTHGSATKTNDIAESKTIKHIYSETNPNVAITASKSILGHSLGGASAIEALITMKSLEDQVVPHIPNLDNLEPESKGLNIIKDKPLKKEMEYAISHSFAFGGNNSVLVLKRWTGI